MELKLESYMWKVICAYAFNRTSMELKLALCVHIGQVDSTFNRTSMELKRRITAKTGSGYSSFNRTSMELKLMQGLHDFEVKMTF